ncbi:MAG: TusE/DsrC/DsvC family sulfur relay protein [Thiopseudomonas sp.]|nr:TusE/DsrC/DsvC family sulfur relay protein [Gammaproteobacteria bacterium]
MVTLLEVEGRSIGLDEDLCLLDLDDWSEAVAASLAREEGIELTPAHWEVLWLVREFYRTFELSPANRALVRYARQQLGEDKGNSLYLNALFNGKPARIACRLAGLPKPANCF